MTGLIGPRSGERKSAIILKVTKNIYLNKVRRLLQSLWFMGEVHRHLSRGQNRLNFGQ